MAGKSWRFELFSFDFAFGALLFGLLTSYTLGNAGTDLGFSENLMLASRSNQALGFAAGCLFAFGNMLLLAATALLGLSFAYGITTASALLMLAAIEFNGERAVLLSLAIVAALVVIIVQAIAAGKGEATLPAASLPVIVRKPSPGSRTSKTKIEAGGMKNSSKGVIASILGGLALGGLFAPFRTAVFSQFGLGAYAGLVLFATGLLAGTFFLNLYFMNISVQGGSIGLGAYLHGKVGQHLLGIVGGALCAGGILLLSLLGGFPADSQPSSWALSAAALGAGVLALALGFSVWRELKQAPRSVLRSVLLGGLFVVIAIGSFAIAMEKVPPLPQAPQQLGLTHTQFPG